MIAIVAPEPAPWLLAVIEAALAAGPVRVLAPWATRAGLPGWLPRRLRAFWQRRALVMDGLDALVTVPGWALAEGALRAWAGARADRKLAARFGLRAAVDHMAARWLAARGRSVRVLIAPSCAARHGLAMAAQHGGTGVLIEDVPDIRGLHADLDAAARAHPDCAFLRRYRAPRAVIVRQETERALASTLLVRGLHARRERERAGHDPARVLALPGAGAGAREREGERPAAGAQGRPGGGPAAGDRRRVLLAGLAAARHGTMEALAAMAARPHLTLLVRPGEGMEPADLLAHPQVAVASDDQRRHLRGIDLVLAPAWCEAYLEEVAVAGNLGVPVVGTLRASGWVTPACEIAPGDAQGLGAAVERTLKGARTSAPADIAGGHDGRAGQGAPDGQGARDRLVAALRAALGAP
jgi:hypothetical protein